MLNKHKLLVCISRVCVCKSCCCQVCAFCCCIYNTSVPVLRNNCIHCCSTQLCRLYNNTLWECNHIFKACNGYLRNLVAGLVVISLVAEEVTQLVVAGSYSFNSVGVVLCVATSETIVIVTLYNIAVQIEKVNAKHNELVCAALVLECNCYITCCGSIYSCNRALNNACCTTFSCSLCLLCGCYTLWIFCSFNE